MAEKEGFEPSIRCRIHTFQACAFDRSAISPQRTLFLYYPIDKPKLQLLARLNHWNELSSNTFLARLICAAK